EVPVGGVGRGDQDELLLIEDPAALPAVESEPGAAEVSLHRAILTPAREPPDAAVGVTCRGSPYADTPAAPRIGRGAAGERSRAAPAPIVRAQAPRIRNEGTSRPASL